MPEVKWLLYPDEYHKDDIIQSTTQPQKQGKLPNLQLNVLIG